MNAELKVRMLVIRYGGRVGEKIENRTHPVSYTHLDVYKRQKVNWLDYKLYPNEKIFAAIDESQERYYLTPEKYEEYYQKILAANDGVYNASIFVALYEGIAGNYYICLLYTSRCV